MELYAVPGDTQTVVLKADSNGNVAQPRDAVELVGSHNRNPAAKKNETKGKACGVVEQLPTDYDPDKNYGAGEVVGPAAVTVTTTIIPVKGKDLSVGAWVTSGASGKYVKAKNKKSAEGFVWDSDIAEFTDADLAVALY